MGLSFTIAAGPRQRRHSQLRDSRPHFTVSYSRLTQTGGPRPRIYIPQVLQLSNLNLVSLIISRRGPRIKHISSILVVQLLHY
jgi:hypothetical protein